MMSIAYIVATVDEAVGEIEKKHCHRAYNHEPQGQRTVDIITIPLICENRTQNLKYKNTTRRKMLR